MDIANCTCVWMYVGIASFTCVWMCMHVFNAHGCMCAACHGPELFCLDIELLALLPNTALCFFSRHRSLSRTKHIGLYQIVLEPLIKRSYVLYPSMQHPESLIHRFDDYILVIGRTNSLCWSVIHYINNRSKPLTLPFYNHKVDLRSAYLHTYVHNHTILFI
jgi:hypothetical protein